MDRHRWDYYNEIEYDPEFAQRIWFAKTVKCRAGGQESLDRRKADMESGDLHTVSFAGGVNK